MGNKSIFECKNIPMLRNWTPFSQSYLVWGFFIHYEDIKLSFIWSHCKCTMFDEFLYDFLHFMVWLFTCVVSGHCLWTPLVLALKEKVRSIALTLCYKRCSYLATKLEHLWGNKLFLNLIHAYGTANSHNNMTSLYSMSLETTMLCTWWKTVDH